MQPKLLTDQSRLQEIFRLRVVAWQNSEHKKLINEDIYPEGWSDNLDNDAYHWIITNECNEVIASARICVIEDKRKLGYVKQFEAFGCNISTPFCLFSRLAIHPGYRGIQLSQKLDIARLNFICNSKIKQTLALAYEDRAAKLKRYGFVSLGNGNVYVTDGLLMRQEFLILNTEDIAILLEPLTIVNTFSE